jgi:glycosyltransferase involved in cell wall biosynthesis
VVVVGDDPYGTDPAYAAAVREAPGVEHFGWAANGPGLMRHLDVLVLPAYREPFGTVLSEAMAVGTPVVASAVDGLPEVVTDGVDGALVAPGDPDALAAAIRRVLARRDELGANAARSARRFATAAVADRVEALLRPRTTR